MKQLALVIVVIHVLILFGHDAAHRALAVHLNTWQTVYAYSVIVTAPLVAIIAVFTRFERSGFALLAVSMFGALVFGVYHHYILISPDHVDHLPAGDSQDLFRSTAASMALVEFAGAALGAWAWRSRASA